MERLDLDPDRLIEHMTGKTIVGGEVGESGCYLQLSDGRLLVFSGLFVIALMDQRTLQ